MQCGTDADRMPIAMRNACEAMPEVEVENYSFNSPSIPTSATSTRELRRGGVDGSPANVNPAELAGKQGDPDMTNDLFIEDDGRGDPTLWETNGQRPIPLCSQSDVDPIAWRLIEGALTIRALHTPVRSDRLNLDLCIRCREVHPCRTITALSFNEHHQGISEGNQMTKNRGDDEGTYDDGWEVALEPIRQAARHPHKGPADTDASMLLEAASRIERGGPAGGSHTTATVSRVLRAVAERVSS